ncbi:MAG TPA: DNA-formamidopyrimidine glycosylase family protein [Planctomycetota bacterium]|jgi:formamidopyrimidine-DNA glycosylase|nr:DNA-formamidopyrimidine glycosylase family protein [Planctomycetota bacterium]
MPELPDIQVYLEALDTRVKGRTLARVRIVSPFLLRTVDPPIEAVEGKKVLSLRRVGKRIVFGFDAELFLVLHLMIAGRLHWGEAGAKPNAKIGLASFDFGSGTLLLTEAGTKKRASLHVLRGEAALRSLDPGGLELLDSTLEQFRDALVRENHTLKRALTDPRLFSGIGNAYSDEILHRAKLSPLAMSRKLSGEETARLHEATLGMLRESIERLRKEASGDFPEGVTAFRSWHAVHGRFKKPCPVCGAPVQRIRYAENETNYCPRCQTGGKVLADRSLSRLLKDDWPRTLDELEGR